MDCKTAKEYLSLYTDGRLSDALTAQLEAHLLTCDACRKEMETLQLLRVQIRALRITEADDFVLDLQRAHKKESVVFIHRGWVRSLCAAAACVVLFVGAYTAVDRGYQMPQDVEVQMLQAQDDVIGSDAKAAPETGKAQSAETQRNITNDTEKTRQFERVASENQSDSVSRWTVADLTAGARTATVDTSTEPAPAAMANGQAVPATYGGGSSASAMDKRVLQISLAPEAMEAVSAYIAGARLSGFGGEVVLSDAVVASLLSMEGVVVLSDVTEACDTDIYSGKTVIIY